MIHQANRPQSTYTPGYFGQLLAVTAVAAAITTPAVLAAPVSAETKPAQPSAITRIENKVNQSLQANQLVSSAHGTLTFKVKSSNPYTGASETHTLTEVNPLVKPLKSTTKLKADHNKLTSGQYAFGYIDAMSADATTHFMKFDSKTMKFAPSDQGHQIRWVKFPDMSGVDRLDYGQPQQANGKPYTGELFGISAPEGATPTPYPPQA